MEKKLKQNEIFDNVSENKENINDFDKQVNDNLTIPSEYECVVKLSSAGKLSMPPVLHFRNYSLEEASALAGKDQDEFIFTFIGCLNEMVYEKINCKDLHESELTEIALYLYASYWGNSLRREIFINENIAENEIMDKENIEEVDVNISDIKTKVIDENFVEPFSVKHNNVEYKFRLPRINDILVAKKFIENKYAQFDRKYSNLVSDLKFNDKEKDLSKHKIIDNLLLGEFEKYIEEKTRQFFLLQTLNSLISIDDIIYDTLDKKISIVKKIPLNVWTKASKYAKQYNEFGVQENVKVFIPSLKKEEIRRIAFQFIHFIPTLE